MAVQYSGATKQSIPAGLFSTADLLMEDRLLDDPGHRPADGEPQLRGMAR